MKVDLTRVGLEPPDHGNTVRPGQAEKTTGGVSSTAGPDQARFQFDQVRVHALRAQVLEQPEIREAKVRTLQESIGKGEYAVPASHVAAALLSDVSAAHG